MASNLIETFQNVTGDILTQQASNILGESAEGTSSALQAIVPTLLGSLLQKSTTDAGTSDLIRFMGEQEIDGSVISQLGSMLSGGIETEKMMYSGAGILRFLLDNKLLPAVDIISGSSKLKTSSATSLFKLAAPLVMGIVARQMQEKSLDAAGLKTLLQGQKEFIKSSLPAAMAGLINPEDISGNKSSTSGGQETTNGKDAGMFSMSKLLPWIVLGLTALGLFYFVQKGCGPATPATDESTTTTDTTAAKPSSDMADEYVSFDMPGGGKMSARKGSFSGKMATFLASQETGDKCLAFDKVSFENGSFQLKTGSEIQLGELLTLMQAYTRLNISIEAYTDNAGDDGKNKSLSRERAKVIKTWLTDHSIAPGRINIKGWGGENPIASNDTEEGRAKNRRVEVCVSKK